VATTNLSTYNMSAIHRALWHGNSNTAVNVQCPTGEATFTVRYDGAASEFVITAYASAYVVENGEVVQCTEPVEIVHRTTTKEGFWTAIKLVKAVVVPAVAPKYQPQPDAAVVAQ
jgi:hypothetical protein